MTLWIDEHVNRIADLGMEREIGSSICDHNGSISVVVKVLKEFHRMGIESVLIASPLPRIIQGGADFFGIAALKSNVNNVPCIAGKFLIELLALGSNRKCILWIHCSFHDHIGDSIQ